MASMADIKHSIRSISGDAHDNRYENVVSIQLAGDLPAYDRRV